MAWAREEREKIGSEGRIWQGQEEGVDEEGREVEKKGGGKRMGRRKGRIKQRIGV